MEGLHCPLGKFVAAFGEIESHLLVQNLEEVDMPLLMKLIEMLQFISFAKR